MNSISVQWNLISNDNFKQMVLHFVWLIDVEMDRVPIMMADMMMKWLRC